MKLVMIIALLGCQQVLWAQRVLPVADPGNNYDYVLQASAYKQLFANEGYVLYADFFNDEIKKQKKHKLVEESWAGSENGKKKQLITKVTYDYDDDGYLIRKEALRNNNKEVTEYIYANDRLLITAISKSEKSTKERKYFFDSLSSLLLKWIDLKGTVSADSNVFYYDHDKHLVKVELSGVPYPVIQESKEIADSSDIHEINYLMPRLKDNTRFQTLLASGGRLTKLPGHLQISKQEITIFSTTLRRLQ